MEYCIFNNLNYKQLIMMLVALLLSSQVTASKFIVRSLPGYPGRYLPFKLETGYFGVGDLDEVQMFYYFIESRGRPKRDPLILWITGGPGCSGFSALAYEIGPISFNLSDYYGEKPAFQRNPYSWTKVANIIFVDAPVGTGFSYATSSTAYPTDDTLNSSHLYEFLRKWLLDHPEFIKNRLYISGDSYGGKMVPMVVAKILHGIEHGSVPHMNLKGYTIGNPVTYEEMDLNSRLEYAFRVSLLSEKLYKATKASCKGDYINVEANNTECMKNLRAVSDCLNSLFILNILEPNCPEDSPYKPDNYTNGWAQRSIMNSNEQYYTSNGLLSFPTHRQPPYWWCRVDNYLTSYVWANQESVREALHVREGTVNFWARCNATISYTKNIESVVDYHRNMSTKSVRALVYSGDQDMAIPYVGTLTWIKSLDIPISEDWRPWFVQGHVAGYTTTYSNVNYRLTYATVKGGGHTAPEYKPEQCLEMITRWLAYFPL